jgi:hypothetical protein
MGTGDCGPTRHTLFATPDPKAQNRIDPREQK